MNIKMKYKAIIIVLGVTVISAFIYIMEQNQSINEVERALENTLQQLENSAPKYTERDDFTSNIPNS